MCIGNIDQQTSKAPTETVARKMKRAAYSSTFLPGPSTSGVQSTMLLKSSEDSFPDSTLPGKLAASSFHGDFGAFVNLLQACTLVMTNLWQTCTLVMTNLWQACCKLKLLSGLCDRFEESDWNEVEFERTSAPDTCKCISLSHTASAAIRTGVSERDAALIASAVLQDAGFVTEDKNLVVVKNKIGREKRKLGGKYRRKKSRWTKN
ncbi:hypothetical protein AVEN_183095-1 [Araneus ventricosus]|uniref:Uncharacterized protein n=1 Tax=Araneus ventricosus TaxID=182803 RepID=A0A4Y2P0F9_ARAVE|nr:hypothetical protein AVEN_183095-1 [Araneus ventricosus]